MREMKIRRGDWLLRGACALGLTGFPTAGLAQAQKDEPLPVTPATNDAPNTPEADTEQDELFARIDENGLKGWATPYPKISDTILRDAGGVRSKLADAGISVLVLSLNSGVYNALHNDTTGPTIYNGQKTPTLNYSNQSAFVTFDTAKIGIDGGQLIFAGTYRAHGLTAINSPRTARVSNLAYYQDILDGRASFKIGYYDNYQEYLGGSVGGSLASGTLGPQSRILVQVGMASSGYGTPAANLEIGSNEGAYTKFGVQRSLPPGGFTNEDAANGSGLRFSVPEAKALFVDEVGYRRAAKPGEKSFWVRGGGIYNTSRYRRYRDDKVTDNFALYLAADHQLTQIDSASPGRGLYVGATANYAPSKQNLYSQYYEGRVYGVGIIEDRPSDLASFVVTYNGLSKDARKAISPGIETPSYIMTATASYGARLASGIYLNPGIGLTKNPAYQRKAPVALNIYFGITLFL